MKVGIPEKKKNNYYIDLAAVATVVGAVDTVRIEAAAAVVVEAAGIEVETGSTTTVKNEMTPQSAQLHRCCCRSHSYQ